MGDIENKLGVDRIDMLSDTERQKEASNIITTFWRETLATPGPDDDTQIDNDVESSKEADEEISEDKQADSDNNSDDQGEKFQSNSEMINEGLNQRMMAYLINPTKLRPELQRDVIRFNEIVVPLLNVHDQEALAKHLDELRALEKSILETEEKIAKEIKDELPDELIKDVRLKTKEILGLKGTGQISAEEAQERLKQIEEETFNTLPVRKAYRDRIKQAESIILSKEYDQATRDEKLSALENPDDEALISEKSAISFMRHYISNKVIPDIETHMDIAKRHEVFRLAS